MDLNILAKFSYIKSIDKRRKNLRERGQILTQILLTEQEYVKTLEFLTIQCKNIMVDRLKIDLDEFNDIFGCIEGIYMLHSELLKELLERFKLRNQPEFRFGDILCKYIPFFKVYSSYIRNLDSHRNALIQIKAQGRLAKFKSTLQQNNTKYCERYSQKILKYLSNIQVQDYINSPNQRLFHYDLILSRYFKALHPSNSDYGPIKEALQMYRTVLNKINQDYGENQIKKCMELEKKFGSIVEPQRKFKGEFAASYWAGGSRMPTCRIYIMNDLILIVDENSGRMVRRMKMDSQSWYHKFNLGKNINNAVFIKGTDDSYQTVFLPVYTIDEFFSVLKRMFSELPNRVSLKNNKPSLIIKPISVTRQVKQYVFTIFIKIHGARGGVYNSYTISQLENVMQLLMQRPKSRKLFKSLEDVTEMSISSLADSESISDFDAEHIALSLFQYFGPLLCDFELTQSDEEFQYGFGIRDYVASCLGLVKYETKIHPLAQQIVELENRVRIQQLEYVERVQVNIHTESGLKRKLIIGKQQRCCSIIRRIFCQEFSMDFALFINSDKSRMRILDDDDILYRVMKRQGYSFKEETSFFMKSVSIIDSLFGARPVTVHLRKYLYLESPYPEMLESVGQQRLSFLTDNILSIMYQQKQKLSVGKVAQMLALVMRLKESGITAQQQQELVSDYWRGKVKASNQSEASFRDLVFKEYNKVCSYSDIECFIRLFKAVEFWSLYAYAVDCRLIDSGISAKLIIKHRVLQIRQTIDSEAPLIRVELTELDYSVTPSYIKINADGQQIKVEVDWVYGLMHVIQRNLQVQKAKAYPPQL